MKKIIVNPFEKYTDKTLLLVGLLSIIIGSVLGFYFNARFDGVFDLHFMESVTAFDPFYDILISVSVTAIVLFLLGKFSNPKTRFIDLLNTALMAKIPFYFLTFFNWNGSVFKATEKLMTSVQESIMIMPDATVLVPILIFSLISLSALVLAIVLCFNGYKVASNAKGNKSVFLFVVALIVAEIISKILIFLLPSFKSLW